MESAETLLEHATWLRRLAASLVRDPDDIVQDTWLAAVRRPPTGAMRPWLARVARNAVRMRWRGDTNRATREAAVATFADAATPTSEELLVRHELQQLLAKLVGELAEPFRSTILLRYAEGLEPTQIARRLAIPASTVRSRIKEGLERLRVGLDAAHGEDRKAWLAALAPIALWPRPAHAAPAAAAPVLAIVALGLVGILVVIAVRTGGAPAAPTAVHAASATTVASAATQIASPSWFVQPGAPARHVTGRVVRDGQPVASAQVRLVADDADPIETRSDAQGRFDLGVQSPRMVTVAAAVPDTLAAIRHVDLRDPSVGELELTLIDCPARIYGHVTDAGGNPIAHAEVLREGAIGTETAGDGAYELCALPTAALVAQLDLVVRADGYGTVATGVAPAGRIQRDFVLAPEATITGTAAAGAAIWLDADRDELGRSTDRAARQVAIVGADGRFRITGASGGRYLLGGAAPGSIAQPALVRVAAGATVDVTVQMLPAATVRGRVVMHGAPVAGARVVVRSVGSAADTSWGAVRHDDPVRDLVVRAEAISQLDGSFVLAGAPVGPVQVTAAPMRVTNAPITLAAGDQTLVLEVASLGRLRGVVRRHGVPVPFARIDVGGTASAGTMADAAGRYEFAGLPPGGYGFYADDARRGAFISSAKPVTLAEGETRDHDIELAWGARVAGDVVDPTGKPLVGVVVRITAADHEQARCPTDATGAFSCGSLRGGTSYAPSVWPGADAKRPFPLAAPAPAIELGADATATGIHLVADPRTTRIGGTVVDEAGASVADARVRLAGQSVEAYDWTPPTTVLSDANGAYHFDGLAPGAYELEAERLDLGRDAHRVVDAGATDVTLALARLPCATGAPFDPPHHPASPLVWDDRIALVGWDLPATARVGEPIEVTLVFRVRAPITRSWAVFAHFDGTAHRDNADHGPGGEHCPTTAWRPGDVIVDRFTTTLQYAERYTLKVGFFRGSDGDGPWQDLAGPGAPVGVELGAVTAAP